MPLPKQLSAEQIIHILQSPGTTRQLAAALGVQHQTVAEVRRYRIYNKISGGPIRPGAYLVGDAIRVMKAMPTGLVRGVVTSPPYNQIEGKHAPPQTRRLSEHGYADYSDDMPWADYVKWQRRFLQEALRLVGPSGLVCYQYRRLRQDGDVLLQPPMLKGMPVKDVIVWDRGVAHNFAPDAMPQSVELIYLLHRGGWRRPKKATVPEVNKWMSVWRIPPSTSSHPAAFPLELARRMVAICDGPVLDPFAGSGTVGLAARELSIPYYLSDLSPEYREMFLSSL